MLRASYAVLVYEASQNEVFHLPVGPCHISGPLCGITGWRKKGQQAKKWTEQECKKRQREK